MDNYTPKQRVFGMLKYLDQILESGESLDARRYEISRNIKNCLSWETELSDLTTTQGEHSTPAERGLG